MSEINQESVQTDLNKASERKVPEKAKKVAKARVSKVPLLLSLLSLACVGYIGYQVFYGPFNLEMQQKTNHRQSKKIMELSEQNLQLQSKVTDLKQAQEDLREEFQKNYPSQTNLIIYQLNALVSGANQSLALYHDYPSAIKQLGYAKQLLISTQDSVFEEIKINLTKDMDNLQALNTYDNTMVAAQLDDLYQQSSRLNLVSIVENKVTPNKNESAWKKFVSNLKSSFFGLVKIEKTNQSAGEVLIPENELVLRQHLQIDILNVRQALMTRNQILWSNSLNDAKNLIQHYFVADQVTMQQLQIVGQLQNVKFNTDQANLDLTMSSLVKLQQQVTGK